MQPKLTNQAVCRSFKVHGFFDFFNAGQRLGVELYERDTCCFERFPFENVAFFPVGAFVRTVLQFDHSVDTGILIAYHKVCALFADFVQWCPSRLSVGNFQEAAQLHLCKNDKFRHCFNQSKVKRLFDFAHDWFGRVKVFLFGLVGLVSCSCFFIQGYQGGRHKHDKGDDYSKYNFHDDVLFMMRKCNGELCHANV